MRDIRQGHYCPPVPNVGIVIVNWNGASDTCDCLRSLLRMHAEKVPIICVVDNASADRSPARISAFATSEGFSQIAHSPDFSMDARVASVTFFRDQTLHRGDLVLVSNRRNYGFAAANNIGYEVVKRHAMLEYVWFLNNDTEVAPGCLWHLLRRMVVDASIGICGAAILCHGEENVVQAYGGVRYSFVTGRGRHIGAGSYYVGPIENSKIESKMSYVSGASMFVRTSLIEEIGPMCEDYFLYAEELDWAWRMRGRYRLGVETAAVVYHKEGVTAGTETMTRPASLLSDFFQARSKLMFARRYTPLYAPVVWLAIALRAVKRYLHGQINNGWVIFRVLAGHWEAGDIFKAGEEF